MEGDELEKRPLELEAGLHDADELAKTFAHHHILLRDQYERGQ